VTAAAALHRPCAGHRARDRADGRAGVSLDPIATQRIEDLVGALKQDYTIVIVTHNMQQAARVADMTAFFSVDVKDGGHRNGVLVEYAPTADLFIRPSDSRTEAYVTGRFG
jgi:phosphate transport system ATP-binding protein